MRDISLRGFNDDQYRDIKLCAAKEGLSMEKWIKALVIRAINEDRAGREDAKMSEPKMFLDPNISAERVYYLVDAILKNVTGALQHMDVLTLPAINQEIRLKQAGLAQNRMQNVKTMSEELFDLVMKDEKE